MKILIVGLNHNTADVEVREKLAFDGPKLEEGLLGLKGLNEINEAVVLSTCNRVEIYANVNEIEKAKDSIKTFISEFHDIKPNLLDDALYFHTGADAVRHSYRVASSLDSMVVGEAQILGQLKEAFEFALERKATGVMLNKLMKKAISVAKRVRTETRIAENAVNISSAAVDLAKKIFSDIKEKSVLLLGAGDMAELAARHLVSGGIREIVVANRTHSTGQKLAGEMGGRAVRFEDFLEEMAHSDIVICSTGAPTYVVTKPQMQSVMKKRKQKHVFIIDISVPRNIDPEINGMENVYLYNVDDLQDVANAGLDERRREAERAEGIVEEEIETFQRWQSTLDAVPTIVALREKAESIKNSELEKIINRLPSLGEQEKKALEQVANSIINKIIHPPTAALKQDSEDKDVLIATIKRLYELDGE
jgi:glutamyl-tRNA reductase